MRIFLHGMRTWQLCPGLDPIAAMTEDQVPGLSSLSFTWEEPQKLTRNVYLLRGDIDQVTRISGKFTTIAPVGGGREARSTVVCIFSLVKPSLHPLVPSARSTQTSWTISE